MTTYSNLHPASQVLMWAFDQTMGTPEQRQEKAERLAQWVMTWRPSDGTSKPVYSSLKEFMAAMEPSAKDRLIEVAIAVEATKT